MEVSKKLLHQMLSASDTSYVIPLYQRNYDWKEEHCRQLFTDLITLMRTPSRGTHFFGSIVSRQASLSSPDHFIIDGQQRITTVSILLLALYNAACNGDIKYSDEKKKEKIRNRYIVDEYAETERKLKLKPIKKDMEAYDNLLYNNETMFIEGSNITRNYRLFYNWIKSDVHMLEDYLNSIERLLVIDIRLDEPDDPQLIFESLNSTGKDLDEADKIRNYLLMSLSNEEQEYYYNNYWNNIEQATDYAPTMFIRDYLTLKSRNISKIENLYSIFKKYMETKGITRQVILEDLLKYAKYYELVQKASSQDINLNKKLKQLTVLGSNVGMPFYMAFLSYADNNNIGFDNRIQVFDIIQNYWARRIVCNEPTNALNKVFSTLHYDIIRLIEQQKKITQQPVSNYVDVLKYVLLKKQGSSIFPDNFYLREEFNTRQIYHIPSDSKLFLFERLENMTNKEEHDIVGGLRKNEITIEHIMPQTLSAEWKNQLGDDAIRVHEQYLHTFANLTITAYNSNYSNHSFLEKKNGYTDRKGNHVFGFKDSPYRLSSYLRDCDNWTETEILERQEKIFKRFITLWPMIETSFEPVEQIVNVRFGDDDDSFFTGRRLSSYTFNETKIKTSSWKDMLIGVCQTTYRMHEINVRELCKKNSYFYNNVNRFSNKSDYTSIGENCYVWSANSTKTKMNIIKHLFDGVGISYDELEFELYPQTDTEKFWSEFINFNSKNNGKYSNISPSRGTWLAKIIDGIDVNVVVGAGICRVELYIGLQESNENKRKYDEIFSRREEIEIAIGESLSWQRLDTCSASKVSISRDMDYTDEKQWNNIFNFFTTYSDKFFKVFGQIIKQ